MYLATLFIFAAILLVVEASILHDLSRHRAHFTRKTTSLEVYLRADAEKRCPNRKSKPLKSNPSPAALAVNKPSSTPVNDGVIKVNNGYCGPNGATREVTTVSGPNGHINWMNCGFERDGWNPPYVQVHDLITVPLGSALQNPESPFKACAAFIGLFEKYGGIYKIPSIMLASFAMQESSCRPWTIGGAGEQGLMQITKEKCGGAPGGNCLDPDFNIGQGAKYFAKTLSDKGGNVFLAVGTYNGWALGLKMNVAFNPPNNCCACQNNGDYLLQFFGGWLLNIDPTQSNRRIGKYFNLDRCRR